MILTLGWMMLAVAQGTSSLSRRLKLSLDVTPCNQMDKAQCLKARRTCVYKRAGCIDRPKPSGPKPKPSGARPKPRPKPAAKPAAKPSGAKPDAATCSKLKGAKCKRAGCIWRARNCTPPAAQPPKLVLTPVKKDPCANVLCIAGVCPDGSNPPVPPGGCCGDLSMCQKAEIGMDQGEADELSITGNGEAFFNPGGATDPWDTDPYNDPWNNDPWNRFGDRASCNELYTQIGVMCPAGKTLDSTAFCQFRLCSQSDVWECCNETCASFTCEGGLEDKPGIDRWTQDCRGNCEDTCCQDKRSSCEGEHCKKIGEECSGWTGLCDQGDDLVCDLIDVGVADGMGVCRDRKTMEPKCKLDYSGIESKWREQKDCAKASEDGQMCEWDDNAMCGSFGLQGCCVQEVAEKPKCSSFTCEGRMEDKPGIDRETQDCLGDCEETCCRVRPECMKKMNTGCKEDCPSGWTQIGTSKKGCCTGFLKCDGHRKICERPALCPKK